MRAFTFAAVAFVAACAGNPNGLPTAAATSAGAGTSSSGTGTGGSGGSTGTSIGTSLGPCAAVPGTCIEFVAGQSTSAAIAAAFATAPSGTTLAFGPGLFNLSNPLAIANQHRIHIVGSGMDVTFLDFGAEVAGSAGLLANHVDYLTLYNFTVQNSPADGIQIENSIGTIVEQVKVAWPAQDETRNYAADGPHGIALLDSATALFERSVVYGASAAGFEIARSTNVLLRGCEAAFNVAGLEFENASLAECLNNNLHDNTAGIVACALPNASLEGSHDLHFHLNLIQNNNTPNFAAAADVVSSVPAGTGVYALACHNLQLDHNQFLGNATVGFAAVSDFAPQRFPWTDPLYDPYAYNVYAYDNVFAENGASPDESAPSGDVLGFLLGTYRAALPEASGPDLLFDGAIDPRMATDAGVANANPADVCFSDNTDGGSGAADFVDTHFCSTQVSGQLVGCASDGGVLDAGAPAYDGGISNFPRVITSALTPFSCVRPPVQGVTVPLAFDGGPL